jgi:imidazolonepropionase-like amidohydrolase
MTTKYTCRGDECNVSESLKHNILLHEKRCRYMVDTIEAARAKREVASAKREAARTARECRLLELKEETLRMELSRNVLLGEMMLTFSNIRLEMEATRLRLPGRVAFDPPKRKKGR